MRELDSIEVTTAALEPGSKQTLILGNPHPDTILLSHFEVIELSPPYSCVEFTDLRCDRVSYLVTPVPLSLIQREHRNVRELAEKKTRQQLEQLLGSTPPPHLLQKFRPNRRETRLITLDIRWTPRQQLTVIFRNFGTALVDKVSIELVLYAFDPPLVRVNQ